MGQKKIAGVKVGKKLNAKELSEIQQKNPGLSLSAIQERVEDKNIKIKAPVRALFEEEEKKIINKQNEEEKERFQKILNELGVSTPVAPGGPAIPQGYATIPEIESSTQLSIEKIRDAGATERLKYEVDNRIPEIQAESKGKLDLQAIVNAGYKNIANIERGTEMVRNITSMFSF